MSRFPGLLLKFCYDKSIAQIETFSFALFSSFSLYLAPLLMERNCAADLEGLVSSSFSDSQQLSCGAIKAVSASLMMLASSICKCLKYILVNRSE